MSFPPAANRPVPLWDRIKSLEGRDGVLSISFIHGFLAGDVPDLGSRILVITDNSPDDGARLAEQLGREAFALRGRSQPDYRTPEEAVDQALLADGGPVVLADVWDNPGGGVAGDSTILFKTLVDRGIKDAAVATIWDPMAVRICKAAGEGATIDLRFGGKICPGAGDPMDGRVLVKKVAAAPIQHFGESLVCLGPAVTITCHGIDVILNTNRCQTFGVDIFSNMGIDPLGKKILVVKSTNHFYAAFSKVAREIIYVQAGDMYPYDARKTEYRKLKRPLWPMVEDPFA